MNTTTVISLSILVSGVIVAGAVVMSSNADRGGSPDSLPAGDAKNVTVSILPDDPMLGSVEAPVTLIMFEDFECPFCGRFSKETLPRLLENEVKEGTLRIVWKDFPLSIHSHAAKAHEAARCAQAEGKFWEYHDLLFANQSDLNIADLKRYARELGLGGAFDSCLDSGASRSLVEAGQREGFAAGVSGTPSFVINGTSISGALPYATLASVIASLAN